MAMAGLKKDVELIFRGEDRASPTIKGVRESVRGLTTAIEEQLRAAERGEGSIDDLAKVYRRLKEAQGDVGDIVKLAGAYESLSAKHAEQAAKAEEARRAEAALTAQISAAENPSKRLVNQRDAATRKADAAAQKERELAAAVTLAGEAFEQAGGDLRNFEASQEAIRTAALETARGLTAAANAMDNYGAAAAAGAKHKAALDEASRFNAMAADSGLPQGQINFISALENRIEALSVAMRENAASAAAMKREQDQIESSNAAARIRERAAAYEEAAQAADRLRIATEFKNQAAGIEAAARDVSRFGAAADTTVASARRLADTIKAISAPAAGASRTLDGINDIVARSEALFDGSKRRMSEYNASLNDLAAAQAGMADMARTIDAFRQQEAVVENARSAMNAAQADVLQLAAAIRTAENPTQEMANELVRAEAALERTGGAVQRETTKLRQLEAALEAAKIDVTQLATAENGLTAAATRAAAAQQRLRGVSRGVGGFMGLNPNELQNLGFQVNDIIVSIASGQNPLTVFIQQGAQIGQIWPGAFSKIAARLPIIAALLAVLIPLGAAVGELAEDGRRSMGQESTTLNAGNLAQFAEKLEEIGVKAADANKIMRELMADGLDAAQMQQYIDTAKAAAEVTGVEFPEAMSTLRESFQGGFEDILALQEQTGVYDQATLDLIETLFEQGRADEARAVALEAYQHNMDTAAASARGPWKTAIDNLGQAWNNFIGWLSNTAVIRAAAASVEWLGRQAAYWSARLAGKDARTAAAESQGANIRPRQVVVADPNRQTVAGRRAIREQQEALEGAQAVTAAQRRQLETRRALNSAIAAGATNREAEQAAAIAGATFDAQEAQRSEKRGNAAARRAEAARRREARAAATAARQIASLEEQLQRQLEQMDTAVGNKQQDNLERRLAAIDSTYERLFRQIDEYAEKTGGRGMIGDRTIEQARQHVEAQMQQLKNYETMEFRERELQNLLTERSEKLDAIDDKVARGIISPEQGLQEADAVINDIATRVSAMATSAIAFAEALRGAVPSPQLDAFIAKMQTALQNNSGGQNVRASRERRTEAIDTAQSGLNEIIARRNQLIEHENLLVQLGLQSRRQAQTNIEGHYNRTSALIRAQIENIRRLAAVFRNDADPAMRLYFDNLIAQLQAVDLQADYVDARFTEMKSSIDQLVTSNIVEFIDVMAKSFADLLTGQTDILGFFESIGRAFLEMIAKTLQGIAMLIIQMIILDAVEKVTGIPVKALLKLYGGAGVFHEGGVVGEAGGRSRQVSPLMFANAPRYHSGGIAGLQPDEMPAILRKGEEVIKESDPRHRFNGGGATAEGGEKGIRQVLAIGDEEIANAMAGQAGERTVMTILKRNRTTVRQMLDN
jgi:hypothetical protein